MKKNFGKIAGLTLAASILMTGCAAQHVPSAADNPKTTTSASATTKASESAKPSTKAATKSASDEDIAKKAVKDAQDKPLGFDVDVLLDEPATAKKFVSELGEKEAHDSVHSALSTYQEIITTQNLYLKRDATKDFQTFLMNSDMADKKIDGELLTGWQKESKKNGTLAFVPVSGSDGAFGYATEKGKKILVKPSSIPTNKFVINEVTFNTDGDPIIKGEREILVSFKDGGKTKVASFKTDFNVSVRKQAGAWKLVGIGWTYDSYGKVVSSV